MVAYKPALLSWLVGVVLRPYPTLEEFLCGGFNRPGGRGVLSPFGRRHFELIILPSFSLTDLCVAVFNQPLPQ